MSDLISRKYAIYELRDLITEPDISDDEIKIEGYNEGIETAISLLSVLSSASEQTVIIEPFTTDMNHVGYCKCGYLVNAEWKYCPSCGAKLIWNYEDIPIEYFESGGK